MFLQYLQFFKVSGYANHFPTKVYNKIDLILEKIMDSYEKSVFVKKIDCLQSGKIKFELNLQILGNFS